MIGLSKIGLWWYSCLILLSFTFQAFVFCNSKHSQQLQARLVSVSRRSLYIYSSWAFIITSSQLGISSMFSMIYSCPCVVLILCLIAMWCGNSYMLSSKVVKSIYKGFNASGLSMGDLLATHMLLPATSCPPHAYACPRRGNNFTKWNRAKYV